MPPRVPAEQLEFAKTLRCSMTRAEALMWTQLRASRLGGHKFRRQVPIGRYVADFLCAQARLVVELDGAPHDDPRAQAHDAARDAWFVSRGYRVLRISNDLVIGGTEIALNQIREALRAREPEQQCRLPGGQNVKSLIFKSLHPETEPRPRALLLRSGRRWQAEPDG